MKGSTADKKRVYRLFSVIFIFAVFCGTLLLAVRSDGAENLLFLLRNADLWWAASGLFLMLSEIVLDSAGLFVPMKKNGERVPFFQVLKSAFIARFFSCITPFNSGGQPAQAFFLGKKGARMSDTLSLLLMKCIIYQAALFSWAFLLFLADRAFFHETFAGYRWLVVPGVAVNLLVSAAMILAGKRTDLTERIAGSFLRKLKRPPEKIEKALRGIENFGVRFNETACRKGTLLKMYLLGLLQVLCALSVTCAVYRALGNEETSFLRIILIQVFLFLLAAYIPTPGGGLGAEGAFLLFFGGIFKKGLPVADLFWRVYTFYLPLVIGAFLTFSAREFRRRGQTPQRKDASYPCRKGSRPTP